MSKKEKRNRQSRSSKWMPPKNYKDFFYASSDEEFKAAHPVGYIFLVILAIAVLLLPAVLFCTLARADNAWIVLGAIGGFVFGIGLFNFVAIIINQYLGRWFSIICFFIGSIMMMISWHLCR